MTGRQQIQVFRTCTCLLDFPKKKYSGQFRGYPNHPKIDKKKVPDPKCPRED